MPWAPEPRSTANTKKPSASSSDAQLEQRVEVRREALERARVSDRDQEPRAALARDARRHHLVERGRRQPQGLGDPQRGLERQWIRKLRYRLTKLEERAVGTRRSQHLDDTRAARLANHPGPAAAERQQHGVCGESCVTDERRLLARIEEPHPQIVIGRGRGRHEGNLGMRELARDTRHDGIALAVRVQNDGGRITPETGARERIDLKDSHPRTRLRGAFSALSGVLHGSARHATLPWNPWGGPWGLRCSDDAANPSNLNRVMPA